MKKTANGSYKTTTGFPDQNTPVVETKGTRKNKIKNNILVNEKIRPKSNTNGSASNS